MLMVSTILEFLGPLMADRHSLTSLISIRSGAKVGDFGFIYDA